MSIPAYKEAPLHIIKAFLPITLSMPRCLYDFNKPMSCKHIRDRAGWKVCKLYLHLSIFQTINSGRSNRQKSQSHKKEYPCLNYYYYYYYYYYYTNIFLQNEFAYKYIYHLHQTQQYDLKKQIKTRSKDPVEDIVEDIVVLSARTIFIIRQKLALKGDIN